MVTVSGERVGVRLVVVCPDRPGIVAAVSGFLFDRGANITDSAQYSTDPDDGTFLMRMEFFCDRADRTRAELEDAFDRNVASRFAMNWHFSYTADRRRIAVLASRFDHCLLELLTRWRRDELSADIVLVVSNHRDVEDSVRSFGVPFEHVPVVRQGKAQAEERMLDLLSGQVDLLVLARYMQILSAEFLNRVAAPAINIHHSFLPAFVGADPYRQALERGVKIIGATAHYATEDLDEGPIIAQDIERVSHRQGLADLRRIGRDIERTVLARAVTWHLEDRVIVHGNKTFVFE